MIEKVEILDEKTNEFYPERKTVYIKLKFTHDDHWFFSNYSYESDVVFSPDYYYIGEERESREMFLRRQKQDLVSHILHLKKHRLRHLVNPYRII